ncbi:hypothetical protein [Kitasatospora cathayae]|uniref:Uncharacterized protein n=1 Tax=Kitasatospora cathayae TaxID=3004092 RepID=A0ABY7QIY1_9ACTN|nr:hypothetical protein [Kitasatospora sp. HUAS 3-15]WBP92215.1 hypothetical protein O1G21_41135 [Kitasatospora sp. HUAS 3-15]
MSDETGAADDLAEALQKFADEAGDPGQPSIYVTVGDPHAFEQRTIQLSVNVADWLTELITGELQDLENARNGRATDDTDAASDWWG